MESESRGSESLNVGANYDWEVRKNHADINRSNNIRCVNTCFYPIFAHSGCKEIRIGADTEKGGVEHPHDSIQRIRIILEPVRTKNPQNTMTAGNRTRWIYLIKHCVSYWACSCFPPQRAPLLETPIHLVTDTSEKLKIKEVFLVQENSGEERSLLHEDFRVYRSRTAMLEDKIAEIMTVMVMAS